MYLLLKYGVQADIRFAMVKRGVVDLAATADWTPATGDTKISKDGGNYANTTNNPAAVAGTGSVGWKLTLTATELQAAEINIQIVDSATKTVEDQFLVIYTYGNASAKFVQDYSDAVRMGLTALPNAAAEAAGGLYTRGSGAGQINQPANGQIDANAVKLGGTAQTGRDIGASVLLSSGTGTGQLDFTSGVVKANLVQILATALTETAGQIAAGFKQFFNIASPTSTMNTVTNVTNVTNLTNAPTAGDLTATMKASVNAEVDTALAEYDGPTFTELDARTSTIDADVQTVLSRLPAALVGGKMSSSVQDIASALIAASHFASQSPPAQGAPPASTDPLTMLGYLYLAMHNRITVTNTGDIKVYADDGTTVLFKVTATDDNTTFERPELVTGP